jgi:hypothetical protein
MTCPKCHRIWKGAQRCFYCGVILVAAFTPGKLSPQQQPAPELSYFASPIVAANTNTSAAAMTTISPTSEPPPLLRSTRSTFADSGSNGSIESRKEYWRSRGISFNSIEDEDI